MAKSGGRCRMYRAEADAVTGSHRVYWSFRGGPACVPSY